MPYIHEVVHAGKTEEHHKYYSWYIHPVGEKRDKQKKPSDERIKRSNLRQAEKKLRGLMNENFRDGDYLLTLDFHSHKPRDSAEMQKAAAGFIKKLRYRLKKQGINPKYIYVMEIGPRGSRHLHMVIEKCGLENVLECWTYGGVHCSPLYTDGQYRQIAAYFLKYALKTEATEERLIGKRWYRSRNLRKPKIIKRIVLSNTFKESAPDKAGWYLDKDSESRGITEAGYQYYSYSYIRIEDESKHLYTYDTEKPKIQKWIRYLRPGDKGSAIDHGKEPDHRADPDGGKHKRGTVNYLAAGIAKIKRLIRRGD